MLSCSTQRIAPEHNLEDAIYEVVSGAIAQSGTTRDELDGVVIATSDLPEGRIIQSMVTAGAVGAVGKPLMTLASSSEHALVFALLQLLGGLAESVVVASWSKTSESVDFARSESFGTDPIHTRHYGLTPVLMTALAESRQGTQRSGAAAEDDPAVPFPLVAEDMPRVEDVVTAMVLTADGADADGLCSVRGVGWRSTALDLALRGDPLEAVRGAADAAYAMADVDASAADVVEVQGGSSLLGRRMLDAAGLSSDVSATTRGGPHDNRAFVGGLATVGAVAQQLGEGAGNLGIAVCGSGFYAQNASVFVLQGTGAGA